MGADRAPIRIDVETHPVEDIGFATFARMAAYEAYENAEDGMAAAVADERYRRALEARFPGSTFTRHVDRPVPGLGLEARIRVIAWRGDA